MKPFGEWLVSDVTTDAVERYQKVRAPSGATSTNRHLELLRHVFNWATMKGRRLAAESPFLDGAKPTIRMLPEHKRTRRLYPGEDERLLAACSPHLWAVVQAALETGMRRGEVLSLQWKDVRLEPGEIVVVSRKAKTKRDRKIPISTTLRAVLEMRRLGPDGAPLPGDAYVFGDGCGRRVTTIKRAWQAALLRANGHKPDYVVRTVGEGAAARPVRTSLLTKDCQARLREVGLHFHDLRREPGSWWLDGGVSLAKIQAWLGHTTATSVRRERENSFMQAHKGLAAQIGSHNDPP